ncbi:MAG: hypothetical protein ACYC7I_03090 [Gammaproteobacteria bacterium]
MTIPRLSRLVFISFVITLVGNSVVMLTASAGTTIINPGGGPLEPEGHHSFLIANGTQAMSSRTAPDPAVDIRDDELANMIFNNTPMSQSPHSAMLFTMGQCYSGGFANDLVAGARGSTIGFAAGARWDQCSYSNATGNTFLEPWSRAVWAPHPDDDQFLQAYNYAAANDPNAPSTFPQYYGVDADTQTLDLGGGNNNFAILFVGDTYGRPDFFSDIDQIHYILRSYYNFDEAHIYALYGNGMRSDSADPSSFMLPSWVDGPGTKAQLAAAIDSVNGAWIPNDGLFFWSSDHGAEATVPLPAALQLFFAGAVLLSAIASACRST